MTTLTNSDSTWLAVAVPKTAACFQLYGGVLADELKFVVIHSPGKFIGKSIPLKPGNYGEPILFKNVPEEMARGMVDECGLQNIGACYPNYEIEQISRCSAGNRFESPIDSLLSLLKSKGLDENTVLIPVKK